MVLNISLLLWRRSRLTFMTKLIPIFIDGQSWIQLSQLSSDQAQSLRTWLPVNYLKKITFQGIELSECLDFDVYEFWFMTQEAGERRQAVFDF